MRNTYILSAKRTPMGTLGGAFSEISAITLGGIAAKAAIVDAKINVEDINEVILGNVVSANLGQGPARQVALHARIPKQVPCTTINKLCASGMKSVMWATQSIQLGDNHLVLSGGFENMTQIPFYLHKARGGYGYGNNTILDGLYQDGLKDAYAHQPMGCFADATAFKHSISREQQDAYAISSYKRAAKAWNSGIMKKEVCTVEKTDRKGKVSLITEDEEYKKVLYDKIPKLKPVFDKKGTVTAANASTINDGAAALILASEDYINDNKLQPIAKVIAYADAAQDPKWFTTTPSLATEKVLAKAKMKISDIDFFEVNEAFSVVPLAFAQYFSLDLSIINIHGGAVSLGHPLGCSGARIITTLLNVLQTQKAKTGLATICNGGGGASAMILEML